MANRPSLTAAAPREHGGDLAAADARFGPRADWLDLSTGVNPRGYPTDGVSAAAWARLPDAPASEALIAAARRCYGAHPSFALKATPGASMAIRLAPRLAEPGVVAVVSPTYNEHAAAFAAEGWRVAPVAALEDAPAGAALAVVSPNNPDGRDYAPERLRAACAGRPLVVVDESFRDVSPDASVLGAAAPPNLLVLRSFGKFYGLAGLRLGVAAAAPALAARLQDLLGPWPVSGPALEIGARALSDDAWAAATRARLKADAGRLDALAAAADWRLVGGAALFRLYETPDAAAAQARLARFGVWSRRFDYAPRWLRLGLPDGDEAWARLAVALAAAAAR